MRSTPPNAASLWKWCKKNRIWSIRPCGHAKCTPQPERFTVGRPMEPPS